MIFESIGAPKVLKFRILAVLNEGLAYGKLLMIVRLHVTFENKISNFIFSQINNV